MHQADLMAARIEFENWNKNRTPKPIQKKYPHGVKIFEKDGKMKNVKYFKAVYKQSQTQNLDKFF